jgi:hypothetical protein
MFQTIIEFRKVAEALSFDTETEKFTHFRKCLTNTSHDE